MYYCIKRLIQQDKEMIPWADEVKKIPTFNDTVYEIDRNTLDMWVKRLKDELKR